MTTYKLKPLKWERFGTESCAADTVFGTLKVFRSAVDGCFIWGGEGKRWEMSNSLSEAQQRAEEWYQERIMPALEPVDGKRGE